MGMFDSVFAPCPICGKTLEFQSKAGECNFKKYHHSKVPAEIANEFDEFGTGYNVVCCKKKWQLKIIIPIPRVSMIIEEVNAKEWD